MRGINGLFINELKNFRYRVQRQDNGFAGFIVVKLVKGLGYIEDFFKTNYANFQ